MSSAKNPLRVTVLCGGPSAERAVSLESGRAVAEALRRYGHDVFVSDIGPNRPKPSTIRLMWCSPPCTAPSAKTARAAHAGTAPSCLTSAPTRVRHPLQWTRWRRSSPSRRQHQTPAHEVWDRDLLQSHNMPTLSLPVVVKPADQGSSVATFIVRDAAEFLPAVRKVVEQSAKPWSSNSFSGKEITIGILGRSTLRRSVFNPSGAFYDYTAKYEDEPPNPFRHA